MTWISTFLKTGLIVSLFFVSSQSFAQKYEIVELTKVLNPTNKSGAALETGEIERLRTLIYDLHPTVYFENQKISSFEQGSPVKAEIYSNSMNLITNDQMGFPMLELIVLKLDSQRDTSWKLDLSSLIKLNNLRYIYIECTFNCDVPALSKMFSNLGEIKVFYQITVQE